MATSKLKQSTDLLPNEGHSSKRYLNTQPSKQNKSMLTVPIDDYYY